MTTREPRNPYVRENNPPTLQESVFVFMDILGYKGLYVSPEIEPQQVILRRLHGTLLGRRTLLAPEEQEQAMTKKDRFALKAFTDSIVMGWPIPFDGESELAGAFLSVGAFQLAMALDGFFLRGGITVGNAYIDDILVFGDALFDAYQGESKEAIFPRIIFQPKAEAIAREHTQYYAYPEHSPHTRDILCDADERWFVNYLSGIIEFADDLGPDYHSFKLHRDVVQEKLQEHQKNPKVYSKYLWVAGYHQFFFETNRYYFDDSYRIQVDPTLLPPPPRNIY